MDKMRLKTVPCILALAVICLFGCAAQEKKGERGRDWQYTVVPAADCPEELKKEVENRMIEAFQMTYDDGESLYMAVGYGEQETGGFSIQVLGLYEMGDGLCLETSLSGPEADEIVSGKPSTPYIVIKTERTEKEVTFQ